MIFGLTIFECVMCLVGALLFLYLLPYIVAVILLIGGIIITGIGLVFEGSGHVVNKLFGGK